MKKIMFLGGAMVLLCSNSYASDLYWKNQYVSVGGLYGFGETKQHIKTDNELTDIDTVIKLSKDKYDEFGLNIGYGANFYTNVRAELSFSYKYLHADSKGRDAYVDSEFDWKRNNFYQMMANMYYDFATGTGFTPYVGLGFGLGYTDFKLNVRSDAAQSLDIKFSELGFMYNIMAGVSYDVTDNWMIDLKYRFVGMPDDISHEIARTATTETDVELDYQPFHEFILSLRYKF